MIAAGKNEVADETFVAVYDEVSPKLFRFFVVLYELRGGHAAKITPDGLSGHISLLVK